MGIDEEWPSCFCPNTKFLKDEQIEIDMFPILPLPSRRKRVVLEQGSMKKNKKKGSKQLAVGLTGCSKCRYSRNGCACCRK